MKISYNWLSQFIHPLPSVDETSKNLTFCGLEVESVEVFEKIKGGLKGLVVGEVLSCEQHPNADRLKLTKVNIGNNELLSIVCGAPNVAIGQKVIVATIGTALYPITGESFTIKESKIRGELSQGMLCAADEIGVGTSHDGIIVLPAETTVGKEVAELYNMSSDHIFEIGLTPNRADAVSHYGVARDLAAVLYEQNIDVVLPNISDKTPLGNAAIEVIIENKEQVKRYSGVVLENIIVKESPEWLKTHLLSIGLKPINNIVDITNYIMFELGQPLHAFDLNKIKGNKVVVKNCQLNTEFTTLDGIKRKLSDTDLMICDAQEPMCLAGVYGGLNSGVSNETKTIFLESATFDAVAVRKSSKFHGLKTDSSFRFERGTDPEMPVIAIKRAIDLITEVSEGKVKGEIFDWVGNNNSWQQINYEWWKMDRLIGEKIPHETAKLILGKLGIKIESENENGVVLNIPPFKVDVKGEADVTEEILRIYGYNKIAIPAQIRSSSQTSSKPDAWKVRNQISNHLCSIGFNEILNNSLGAGNKNDLIGDNGLNKIEILNPLSTELNTLRQSLTFNLCETIAWNINRQQNDLQIFEWGKTYGKTGEKYIESNILGIASTGNTNQESWQSTYKPSHFYQIKGVVDSILQLIGINPLNIICEEVENNLFNQCIQLKVNKKVIGIIGLTNSKVNKITDINNSVWLAELNWDILFELFKNYQLVYKEVSKFPSIRRDLALLIDAKISFQDIVKSARNSERKHLQHINLFDIYEGEKLPKGKKSYAVSFNLIDEEKTMTDAQIESIMNKLINTLNKELNAELRS
jgi:phenylalanyl-tRNA synthetase beta chain